MAITSFYAGFLGLWLVLLSVRVILTRRSARIGLGHSGNPVLERRIRAHGNLCEYAPIGLLLIGFLEMAGFQPAVIHVLGAHLLLGRLLHGYALSFTHSNGFGRVGGMALTLSAIGIAGFLSLFDGALRALSGS